MKPLVVIGAGPVGLATAIAARHYGLPCVVIDKREPPFDKACGEGIMPAGVQELAWLGVTPRLAAPFVGIRYIDGTTAFEGRLRAPGLGVRRTTLSEALIERARAVGVSLCFSIEARKLTGSRLETSAGVLDARLVVGADGLHSRVRALAGIAARRSVRVRYGIRRHYAVPPWNRCVEVYWSDACEAYVTPVAPDTVGVAVIAHGGSRPKPQRGFVTHGQQPLSFDAALARFPALERRLAGAEIVSHLRGAGPMYHRVHRRYAGHVALVGDAAGYVDACTGEGLSTGFACARALAETVAEDRPLAHYEDRYRRITRGYYLTTNFMLALARRPTMRRRAFCLLQRTPAIFDLIIAVHGAAANTPLSAVRLN